MTSGEVAVALGVGASTVKRWTDTGELACVKTLGKHRRFAKAEVQAFAKRLAEGRVSETTPDAPAPQVKVGREGDWLDVLAKPGPAYVVQAALVSERAKLGSWHQVAARIGAVIDALATTPIAQQHHATERLTRGLILVSESLVVRDDAPVCLLATGEDETHTLTLVELTLREAGWQPHWLGSKMPAPAIADFVTHNQVQMVALSASAATSTALAQDAQIIGDACNAANTALVLTGHGHWPDPPPYGRRVRTFTSLYSLLEKG